MLALQPPATVPVVFFALKGKGSAGVVRPRQRACTQSPVRASLSWHARCHGGCVSEGRKSGDWSALTRFPESCAAFAEVCEWVRTDERLITILQTVQMVSAQTCSRSQRSLLEPSGRRVGLQCQRIACRAPEQKSSRIHHQTSWELCLRLEAHSPKPARRLGATCVGEERRLGLLLLLLSKPVGKWAT